MRARSGAAVVVDVASGKILGAYHLEVASRRLARPGSAFKPFTLLALLESGKLKPDESFTCRRNLHVGSHNLSCSHRRAWMGGGEYTGQHDPITATEHAAKDECAGVNAAS
jgi:cell division protein FtsI/penicillin-binding protein 2